MTSINLENDIIHNPYLRYVLDFFDKDVSFRCRIWRLYNLTYSNGIYAPSDNAYDLAHELAEEMSKAWQGSAEKESHNLDIDDLTNWLVKNNIFIIYWDNRSNKWDITASQAVKLFFGKPKRKYEYLLILAIIAKTSIIYLPIISFFYSINTNLQAINVNNSLINANNLFLAGLLMITINYVIRYFTGSNALLIRNSLLNKKDVFFPLYGSLFFNIFESISLTLISYALGASFSDNLDTSEAIVFIGTIIILILKIFKFKYI